MRKPTSMFGKAVLLLIVAVFLMGFTACSAGETSSAMCAFVVGDGTEAHQNRLEQIVYPGQPLPVSQSYQKFQFIPCNDRNFMVMNGKHLNGNQKVIGDLFEPIMATTRSGYNVIVTVNAYWTPNQQESAMRDFYKTLYKYKAFSDTDAGGDANFSTDGWNGMLGEVFRNTMINITPMAFYDPPIGMEIDDNIWLMHDPFQKLELGDRMSAAFQKALAKQLGYKNNIVCGAGSSSSWPDPLNPGHDKFGKPDNEAFNCSPVRIEVTYVDLAPGNLSNAGPNAKLLYGPYWAYFNGLNDLIRTCGDTSGKCNIAIGTPDSIPMSIPSDVQIPTPGTTPTPKP